MERYLITQSLLASWGYLFSCYEESKEKAEADFIRTLNREPIDPTDAMVAGRAFENAVYMAAAGTVQHTNDQWEFGIQKIASILRDAPVQVKVRRELHVLGKSFLVYGILDALKAGIIYDVKFSSQSFTKENVYLPGKYMESPQHPAYLYMVPEAYEFQYLVSDGCDLYIERYTRQETPYIGDIIASFIQSLEQMKLVHIYRQKWLAL